ncbi:hypothetical protein ID866_3347 [Astraeus odoratus]|nr:hypothetical protein ID866_3347 [Astraeus odoratus]
MESDYDVCVECGSLAECEHDREEVQSVSSIASPARPRRDSATTPADIVDYLEMRTDRPVPPHSEVFNTYGLLPNTTLLTRYGFMLSENDFDTVKVVIEPVSSAANRLLHVMKPGSTINITDERRVVTHRVGEESYFVRNEVDADGGNNYFGGARLGNPDNNKEQGTRESDDGIGNNSRDRPLVDCEAPIFSNIIVAGEGSAKQRQEGVDVVERFVRVFSNIARAWSADTTWDEYNEGLVYNPETSRQVTLRISDDSRELVLAHGLLVNADGKLSHYLWLFSILVAVFSHISVLDANLLDLLNRVENEGD